VGPANIRARADGRHWDEPRKTTITPGYQAFAEGSALIEVGLTKVLCAATIEERVPPFLRGEGKGWVTAEYSMLPRSTGSRTPREGGQGQVRGRSQEIQRLIGRCLRAVTDRTALGERTVLLDCDVIQADGGTRTAAVTGAYVALYQALWGLVRGRILAEMPLDCAVAAVSVGLVDGNPLLDLSYAEDVRAKVDFNIAMTDRGDLVELQGAGEGGPFRKDVVPEVVALASSGIEHLFRAQRDAIHFLRKDTGYRG
jgi:ribonuclease PH